MAANPFAKPAAAAPKKAGKAPFPPKAAAKAAAVPAKGFPPAAAGMPPGFKKGGMVKAGRGC